MRNKKAWLKIMEAFIAILMIVSVMLISISQIPEKDRGGEIQRMQRFILQQISLNETLRKEILAEPGNKENAKNFVGEMLPGYLDFELKICEINEICGMSSYTAKEVYADEILISSTLQEYNPKKLKLFVWEK